MTVREPVLPRAANECGAGARRRSWLSRRGLGSPPHKLDNNWLDNSGHPGTEALHLTERFRRRDFGHIDAQITIDDPKAYTKPWSVNLHFTLADTELIEYVCDENEKDLTHLVGK